MFNLNRRCNWPIVAPIVAPFVAPIQIKHEHSSVSYQWVIYHKYDQRGCELPSEYGALLPTGSEEREVLGVGSIPFAILPSCQDMKTFALLMHKHQYSWVVKIRYTSKAVLRPQYTHWPSY